MYKSIEELQDNAKTGPVEKFPVKSLCESSLKVIDAAEKEIKQGNEEKAYILCWKYCQLCQIILKRPEYIKDSKYFDGMFKIKANYKKSLINLEALTASLEKEYSQISKSKHPKPAEAAVTPVTSRRSPLAREAQKIDNNNDIANTNGLIKEFESMTVRDLYTLIQQKSTSFLLLDARPTQDYDKSQIKSPNSLSIPEDRLSTHATANAIEKSVVKVQDRHQWQRRDKVDKLIILDWNSKDYSSKALTILRDAIIKWDTARTYKSSPVLLEGGFELFRLAYPHMVTDPKFKMPSNLEQNKTSQDTNVELEKINFPDFDQAFMITPSPSPKSLPAITSGAIRITRTDSQNDTNSYPQVSYPDLNGIQNVPVFDRRSKPINIEDSTSSTDQSDDFNNARLSGISINSMQGPASALSSTSSLNNAMIATSTSINENSTLPSVAPTIDRSSKPSAESVYSKARTTQDLAGLLEVEEELADLALDRSKENLQKELEWARLCQKREQEANEDIRSLHDEQVIKLSQELEERDRKITETEQREKKVREELENLRKQLSKTQITPATQNQKVENERKVRFKEEEDQKIKQEIEDIRRKRRLKEEQRRAEKHALHKALIEEERRKEAKRREEEQFGIRRGDTPDRNRRVETPERTRRGDVDRARGNQERPPRGDDNKGVGERGRTTERLRDGGSKMRRSHSCVNVAQMMDQDGGGSETGSGRDQAVVPVPKFDRKQKPMDIVKRDFAGVWGTTKPGLTGLRNLGNTCYMNSILQCISNTEPIVQYFVSRDFEEDINSFSSTRGEIAMEFGALLQQLWSHQFKSISPTDLKSTVGRFYSAFAGRDQQDSHEFLSKLLEWLHNDTNRIKKPSKMPEIEASGSSPSEVSCKKFWRTFLERNQSIIVQLFYGVTLQTTTCIECGFKSLKFQEFYNLNLFIPEDRRISLEECLRDFVKENQIDYTCEKCRSSRGARQKVEIVKLPPLLIIHLERFLPDEEMSSRSNEIKYRKKQAFVSFRLTDLNLEKFTCGNENKYTNFNLYAVSNHFGSLEGGHYTASCYSKTLRSWYKYDDQEVRQIDESSVQSTAAYILFYSALSNHPLLPLG